LDQVVSLDSNCIHTYKADIIELQKSY